MSMTVLGLPADHLSLEMSTTSNDLAGLLAPLSEIIRH